MDCLFECLEHMRTYFFKRGDSVTHMKIQEFQMITGDFGVLYELGQYDLFYTYEAIALA